jgi:hypothetical protein
MHVMDAESLLEAIAVIGISLACFAGIVGALAGEKLRRANPQVWLPFWVMISRRSCGASDTRCARTLIAGRRGN